LTAPEAQKCCTTTFHLAAMESARIRKKNGGNKDNKRKNSISGSMLKE